VEGRNSDVQNPVFKQEDIPTEFFNSVISHSGIFHQRLQDQE
jgi:hypothetical protein